MTTSEALYTAITIVAQTENIVFPSMGSAQKVRAVMATLLEPSKTFNLLETLRNEGWMVAAHNDYQLNGSKHTFYLFTHQHYGWVKGEGINDRMALEQATYDAEAAREIYQRDHKL